MFSVRFRRSLRFVLPFLLPAPALAADGLFVIRGYSNQQLLRMETDGTTVQLPLVMDLANRVRVLGDRLVVVDSGAAVLHVLPLADALAWLPGDPAPVIGQLPVSTLDNPNPWDVIRLEDGRLAVSNLNTGTISLLAADTLQHEAHWPGASPQGLAQQAGRLLATDSGFGIGTRLLTLDLGTLLTGEVPTLENPQDLLVLPERVDVLCSGNWFTGEALVHGLDPVTLAPVDTLRLGAHAGSLAADAAGIVYSGDLWAFPVPGTYRYDSQSRLVSHDADAVFGPGGGYPFVSGQDLYTCGPTSVFRMDFAGNVLDTLETGGDVAHFTGFTRPGVPVLQVAYGGNSLHFQWTPAGWTRWNLWRQPFGGGPATRVAVCDEPSFVLPLVPGDTTARFAVTGTDE